jgi:hypothetical protein
LLTQKAKSSNVLALDYSGLTCAGNSQIYFNGGYAVDGTNSLGKFANAVGSGTLSGSLGVTGTLTLGNITGTLELAPPI